MNIGKINGFTTQPGSTGAENPFEVLFASKENGKTVALSINRANIFPQDTKSPLPDNSKKEAFNKVSSPPHSNNNDLVALASQFGDLS